MPVTSIMQLLHAFFFSARGNIVRIDSCTDDSIRISLTVAIRLIGAPVNRYTPSQECGKHLQGKMSSSIGNESKQEKLLCFYLGIYIYIYIYTVYYTKTHKSANQIHIWGIYLTLVRLYLLLLTQRTVKLDLNDTIMVCWEFLISKI